VLPCVHLDGFAHPPGVWRHRHSVGRQAPLVCLVPHLVCLVPHLVGLVPHLSCALCHIYRGLVPCRPHLSWAFRRTHREPCATSIVSLVPHLSWARAPSELRSPLCQQGARSMFPCARTDAAMPIIYRVASSARSYRCGLASPSLLVLPEAHNQCCLVRTSMWPSKPVISCVARSAQPMLPCAHTDVA
jgi:hypothetical protein